MFQISKQGTRAGILKAIAMAEVPKDADKVQVDAIKAFIVSEVNALPTEFNGCRVDAQGSAAANQRNLNATVIGLKLEVEN